MKRTLTIPILTFLIVLSLTFTGCTPRIPANRLSYFQSLDAQKYWTEKPLNTEVEGNYGQKITLFADNMNGKLEGIEFGKITITQTSNKGTPEKGYITIKIINSDGIQIYSYKLDINKYNEVTLKKLLSNMETNQQKAIKEAKNLIDAGNLNEAVAKLKGIEQTDKVKSLIDFVYYKMATNDFKEGNYDKTLSDLSNIKFDENIIQNSKDLKAKTQKCKNLLSTSKNLISKAQYSEAKKNLLELKSINDTKEVEDLLNQIDNPWLLNTASIKEAANYGQKSKNIDFGTFIKPWFIGNLYSYKEKVSVMTPYLGIATFAYDNAKKYKTTLFSDAVKLLNSIKTLDIYTIVYGDDIDFATDVNAVIKVNGKIIHPVKSNKKDFAETTSEWPYSPAYYANNVYSFSLKEIPRNAKIQLIIIYPDREVKINIDLSKMK